MSNLTLIKVCLPGTGVGVKYTYERWSTDDRTWTNWTYNDGTRVKQDLVQKVHIVGIYGYYKWW